jgi:hypothetical protein
VTYDRAVEAWVKAVRENTVGFPAVEQYWAVTVGMETAVCRTIDPFKKNTYIVIKSLDLNVIG